MILFNSLYVLLILIIIAIKCTVNETQTTTTTTPTTSTTTTKSVENFLTINTSVGAVDDSNLVDNKTTTLVPTTTTTVIDDDYNDNDDSEDDINGNYNNNSTTDAETIITGDDEDNNEESEFREPRDPSEFMDYFDDLMGRTRVRLEELFEQYMPQLIQMSSTVQLSPQCTLDAIRILMGLRKLQPWAIKMLDSSGKVPDGILGGTLTALGSYDDCLESRIGDDQTDTDNTKGQYCAINVRPYLPPKPPLHLLEKEFNDAADAKGFAKEHHFARIAPLFYYLRLRLGICVPASCQMTDMDLITKRISYRFRVNVSVQHCDIKPESFAIESDQYGPLAVIAGLLIVIASATIYDTMVGSDGGGGYDSSGQTTTLSSSSTTTTVVYKIRKFLANCFLTFSVRLNSSIIMSTATTNVSANHHIRPLNGLRVISLVWIMIAHTYMTLDYRATGRLITTKELPKGLIFQTILNASLAIETFFFLSGLLVTYNCIIRMNQSNRYWRLTDWLVFYIHRYIRLTPAIMLLIVIFLFGYRLGNGPLWQELIYPTAHKCRDNWWTHLLYISNFINGKDMCFLHLWYIAADMQLFILTPIFLAILHRHAYLGQLLLIISIVLSILSSGIITYIEDLPPTLLFNNPDPSARRLYGNLLFVKPYPHAAPYVVGMLTGYLLYQYSHIKLSLKVKSIGWLLATMVVVLEIFGTWIWNSGHSEPTRLVSTLYAGLSRTLWALAMAWIIVACHNGFGGTLNSILSASMFVPLSRLSYVAYLIHPGMMYVFIASTRNVYAFSHYFVIQLFFSHLTTTYIVSYLLALVIEYPFVSLETIVYKKLFSNTSTGSYSSSTSSSISHNNKPRLYAVTSVDSTASGQYFISNNSGQQDNNENNDRPHNRQQFFGDKYINTLTSEFEKIAIIVILSGCGLAIALAFAVLICCQLLIKPKYSRYGCADSVIVFERQTTTSDENNIDYNSGCFEDSFYTRDYNPGADSDTNPDTCVSSPNTVVAVQTHNNCMVSTTTPSSTTTSPTPTTAIAMVTTVSAAAADTITTTTPPLSQHSNGAHTPPLTLPSSSSSSTTAAPLPSSSSSSPAQPLSSALPNLQQRQRSSSHQVKFSTRPPLVSTRKTSLPCKFVTICYDNKTDEIVSNDSHRKKGNNGQQRRLSAGIIRQKSFEDIEEDISYNNQQIELSERRRRNSLEDKTIDKDVLRRQYKDLWHLRTTYEAEEDESLDHQSLDAASVATAANIVVVAAVAEPADSLPIVGPQKLTKNDSGYKSIERRDYSIDYKSEYIYRQFTTQTSTAAPIVPQQQQQQQQQHRALSITHQQSIKEEQETDIHAVFV